MTDIRFLQTKCAWLLVCLAIWGCDGGQSTAEMAQPPMQSAPQPPPEVTDSNQVAPPAQERTGEHAATEATTPPLYRTEPNERIRKRLNVDQLSQAILSASVGLKWRQGNDEDLLSTLALTLGKPDYLEVTRENLETNVLFMKFLEDAAGSVCKQMVDRDVAEGTQMLIPDDGEEPTQLIKLIERFHHRVLTPQDSDLQQWIWLYESAAAITNEPTAIWHTVCVALMRHPDFYTY